jgi:hypothetical protein
MLETKFIELLRGLELFGADGLTRMVKFPSETRLYLTASAIEFN